ncbi:WD40 repeat domain-containing serine/threonine protein kinase [Verrucomicrobium sp. BvORR106]|uniref:WD40 repeat domain-containing serine/threonine protein kinase n=1 Tax=Verrucomicrobium sp. BvORR106 TaxID=1403819 RepID=UPI000690078E|nr:WD40 repeat domain-containing serine/threonine protein kinase [Verrucomicrobium sp. BvORR106]
MESTAPAATCASCGRPLGPTAAGAFCLSCLLSPAKNWLDQSEESSRTLSSLEEWEPGDKIDRYQLEELLGEGGFGIVYRAIQLEPIHREVALKVLKPRMASRDIVARFEGERQALAMMDHPNIARVYDAGATFSGCPYFVMELVKGKPITEFSRHLPLEQRIRLFIQACRGVQHAHQKGVIHRDIKPSNVLVMGEGIISVAKVIDFGIAKALEQPLAEKTIYTAQGQVMGTLQYMSPEQALSAGMDVDTRSDVYSLGVLLYEMLTGVTPLAAERASGNDLAEILRAVRDETPVRPSQELDKAYKTARTQSPAPPVGTEWEEEGVTPATLRGDLDWIVMKALEKERARRYPSVSALMEDLERFLKQEPVQAKAPTARYRVARFARRNTILLRFVGALALVLGVSTAILIWLTLRATRAETVTRKALAAEASARQETTRQEAETRRQLVQLDVVTGDEMVEDGDAFGALLWYLEALRLDKGDPAKEILHRQRFRCAMQSGPQLLTLWPGTISGEFSPDGSRVAVLKGDGTAQLWSCETQQPAGPPLTAPGGIRWIRFTDDPRALLGISRQGLFCEWDLQTGILTSTTVASSQTPAKTALDLTPDGKWLAVTVSGGPQVFRTVPRAAVGPVLEGAPSLTLLRLSHDGRRLAGSDGSSLKVWDARSGKLILSSNDLEGSVAQIAMSPDGTRMATVSGKTSGTLDVWDVDLGSRMRPPTRPGGKLLDCTFSPEGRRLAVASHDAYARVFDVASGLPLTESMRHSGAVMEVHFSGDGRRVATSAVGDGNARIWDGYTGLPAWPWICHPSSSPYARISADGSSVLTGGEDGALRLWRTPVEGPAKVTANHGAKVVTAAQGAAGRLILSLGADGLVRLWNRATGDLTALIQPSSPPAAVELSQDENWVVTGGENGMVQVWDSRTGKPALPDLRHGGRRILQVQFAASGEEFFSLGEEGSLKLWNRRTGMPLARQLEQAGTLIRATYDATGERLLAADTEHKVGCWEVRSGSPASEKIRLPRRIDHLAFSSDGKRWLTASLGNGSFAQVWDAVTLQPIGPMLSPGRTFCATLSPDGATVVTCGADNTARIWNAASGGRVGRNMTHSGHVFRSVFSPDGRMVATCSDDGTARVWDALNGAPVSPPLPQGAGLVYWNRSSTELLTASASGVLSLWDVSPMTEALDALQVQAELLSGRKLDALLGTTLLTGSEVAQRWQQRARHLPQPSETPPASAVSRR